MPWIGKPSGQRPERCQETAGFLFAHDCDRPPAHPCDSCGRPICVAHTRLVDARRLCVTCVRQSSSFDDRDPYFYGRSYYGHGWHQWGYGSTYDPDDFTDGDAASLQQQGDATFEDDLDAS